MTEPDRVILAVVLSARVGGAKNLVEAQKSRRQKTRRIRHFTMYRHGKTKASGRHDTTLLSLLYYSSVTTTKCDIRIKPEGRLSIRDLMLTFAIGTWLQLTWLQFFFSLRTWLQLTFSIRTWLQ